MHTHTHRRFDQGQLTIQLILVVTELIQEVKTTLVNLIKMGYASVTSNHGPRTIFNTHTISCP